MNDLPLNLVFVMPKCVEIAAKYFFVIGKRTSPVAVVRKFVTSVLLNSPHSISSLSVSRIGGNFRSS